MKMPVFEKLLPLLTLMALSVSHSMGEFDTKATPIESISVKDGFEVDLLFTVPKERLGSWVNLCLDNKNRIIASDQFGGLYRFQVPANGNALKESDIEKIPANIRAANGLLWAFDCLYVAVNDYEKKMESGVYRITDSNGDDQLDKVEKLRGMQARGDHGVHALLLGPDKKSIYLITGNNTTPVEANRSRVPMDWGEDHLLPRMPDGRGHNRERLAPAGIIYKISPDGKDWEIVSSGYRNIFDGAFNSDGELFTYDADMEYDFNTPWYRPTRICHVTSGSMYGWRNGTGKRPDFYSDTLPPVVNIGPGSPTGVTFGYGAKFPSKYQKAMFILDWSWGKIYAVHMKPDGSTYTGVKETFITGSPLPVTDAIIHPEDGSMYFAIGGRRVQSGLYRVRYVGEEKTDLVSARPRINQLAELRRQLETLHVGDDPKALESAWPHIDHADRFIRWAALMAIQRLPVEKWAAKALNEKNPGKRTYVLLSLAKASGIDPFHRKESDPPVDLQMGKRIIRSLLQINWDELNSSERMAMIRAYQVAMVRFGKPSPQTLEKIIVQLDPQFPSQSFEMNWLLCETLSFLEAPSVATKAMALLNESPTQEEQMEYARSLRTLKTGWTDELRKQYFNWFLKAANYRGGASFSKFIEFIRTDAVASLSPQKKEDFAGLLAKKAVQKSPAETMAEAMAGRTFVKNWEMEALSESASKGLKERNFESGRKMFAAGGCFACHRFGNQGGMNGPDLTGSGGRYSPHDLLEQIIYPSKEINEQFVPTFVTLKSGEALSGVVVNLNGDRVTLNTDLYNPNQRTSVLRKEIQSMGPSPVSPMPPGLLNMMEKDEIMDLLAYILSGGDPQHDFFKN
ncbi:MAG: c-type cytochrome [Verrucomicrobiota bacterium]|nr:c-type cytochrome [Verrucomicrobiota bacterium]